MLTKKEARTILLQALSRGGEFAEIFMERRRSTVIELDNGKIEQLSTGADQGAGIRVVAGKKTYFFSSNQIDAKALLETAGVLAQNINQDKTVKKISFRKRELNPFSFVKIPPGSAALSRKVALLRRADKAARARDHRIAQVSCVYRDFVQDLWVINSEGVFENDKRTYPALIVTATAKEGELLYAGKEVVCGTCGFELFDGRSSEEIALEAARSAIFQLEAKPAPAGTYQIVIMAEAGGGVLIHEAVGHGLEADLVEQGASCYAGKIGQKVASELITVVDDRTIPDKRGTAKIDDEGYPCQRTVLIRDGILVGYLQNREFARKNGVPQTGHGRRESFHHLPIPRMGNTMIVPGKTPAQEIIDSLKEGILITKMAGTGEVDTASGNFIFSVTEAYLIKDGGNVREPIRGATLVGNGPHILSKEILMVGNDIGFDGGTCGKGKIVPVGDAQPTIMIRHIVVGGLAKKEEGK